MLVDIKGSQLELFWGEGQQCSPGTGDGAWTKITYAKGGVTEKFKKIWYKIIEFFVLYWALLVRILPRHPWILGKAFCGSAVNACSVESESVLKN